VILAVPLWGLLRAPPDELPHITRLPAWDLESLEGIPFSTRTFLGEVLIIEVQAGPCEGPCEARRGQLQHLQAIFPPTAPVRILSLVGSPELAPTNPMDPTRWNALQVGGGGPLTFLSAFSRENTLPQDAILLVDAQGSLRGIFSPEESETLERLALQLAEELPQRPQDQKF